MDQTHDAAIANQAVQLITEYNQTVMIPEIIPLSRVQIQGYLKNGTATYQLETTGELISFSRSINLLNSKNITHIANRLNTPIPIEIGTLIVHPDYRGNGIGSKQIAKQITSSQTPKVFFVSVITRQRTLKSFQKVDAGFTSLKWHEYPFLAFLVNTINTKKQLSSTKLSHLYLEKKDHISYLTAKDDKIERTLITNDTLSAKQFELTMKQHYFQTMNEEFPDGENNQLTYLQFTKQADFFNKIASNI